MPVKLTDKVYNEGGSPVQGAVAQAILTNGTTTVVSGTDLTDVRGVWAFDTGIAGHQPDLADPAAGYWYDVRINMGMQYRLRYGAIKAMMSMVYLANTIVLGATQLFDASLAAMRIPIRASDPTPTAAGQIVFRSDTKSLRIHDGTQWYGAGTPEQVVTGTNYAVASSVGYVFCSAAVTVTLPAASDTIRPEIWIKAVAGNVTVAAASGSVVGGSFDPNTGAVINGQITSGDSITWKSNGSAWYAV